MRRGGYKGRRVGEGCKERREGRREGCEEGRGGRRGEGCEEGENRNKCGGGKEK